MKNLKKILSLVLAVVMVVALGSFSFAAEKSSGQILQELGFLKGNETGDLMEDSVITRAEAAVIVTRLMGWKIDNVSANPFVDITAENGTIWAAPYAALMYENKVTVGVSTEEKVFAPNQEISEFEVYVWLYRAMFPNEKDAWFTPSLLTEKGLATEGKVSSMLAADTKPARRAIFDDMLSVLTADLEGTTLIEKLAANDLELKKKAEALGLIKAPETAEAKITLVEILNYSQVKITWNKDAVTDSSEYTLASSEGAIAIDNLEANEAKTEVIITFSSNPISAQDDVKVVCKGQGVTATGVIDATAPTITNISVAGKNQLKITFSEPIATEYPNVQLNNGMIYVDQYPEVNAAKTEFIYNAGGLVAGEKYNVTIKAGVTDFANIKMKADFVATYTYTEVTDAVQVSIKEATTSRIVLALTAPTTITSLDAANFSYIFSNMNPTAVAVSTDGKEVTLTLGNYQVPTGTWTLDITNADQMFVDSWGNKSAKDISLKFTVVIDTVKPTATLTKFNQAEGKLEITFSENVSNAKVEIFKKEDSSSVVTLSNTNYEDKKFTADFNKEAFETGEYTVRVTEAVDDAGNKMSEATFPVSAKAMKPVTVGSIQFIRNEEGKAFKYYVTFSNAMDSSILNSALWSIEGAEIKTIAFEDATRKVVVIELKEGLDNGAVTITSGLLKDVEGNGIKNAGSFSAVLNNAASETITASEITGSSIAGQTIVNALGAQKVEFRIPGVVDKSTISASNISFAADTLSAGAAAVSVSTVTEDNGAIYTVITVNVQVFTDNYKIAADATVNSNEITASIANLKMANGVAVNISKTVADKIKPAVDTIEAEVDGANTKITLGASEALDDTFANYFVTELVVKYDGAVLVAGTDYVVAEITGSDIVLTIKNKNETGKKIEISLANSSKYVNDENQNALESFSKDITIK